MMTRPVSRNGSPENKIASLKSLRRVLHFIIFYCYIPE